jgi:LacI family transcriptional regulator
VPTISDVARRSGVSPVTVSRVINNAAHVKPTTRAAVERAIAELSYVPNVVARSLRSRRTRTLGLLLPDITNPFWTTVARGVEDSAHSHGYSVFLCNTDENPAKQQQYLDAVLSQRVDGVIIAPYDSDARNMSRLQEQNIPVVVVDRAVHDWDTDTVVTDSVSGAVALVRHLIELGHTRIAVLSGPPATSTASERVAGYCLALGEAGIPVDPRLIRRGEFRAASGEHMVGPLLDGDVHPTAIFAANNTLAQGALEALGKRGLRVPEDVALVCFDDFSDFSAFFPFMTVVAQPAYEMGSNAAQLLFSRLQSETALPPRCVVLPARLVRRYSCGRHLMRTDGRQELCLPMPRDAHVDGVLVMPLSDEERHAALADLGLADLATPGGARHARDGVRRPPEYDKPDATRLLRVLRHQPADRVPHLDIWVTSRSVYEYVLGRELRYPMQSVRLEGQPVTPEDHVEFAVRLGMDAVACNFTWRPNNVFARASDGSEHYVTGSVRTWAHLDNLEPPPALADQLDTLERYLRAAQGSGVGVFANFTSFFDSAMRAVGIIEALYLFYDDRPFLEALMDTLLAHQERVVRAVCDRFAAELAFVMVNDEIAHNVGLMIRPDMFEQMFTHRMERLIAPAKEHGKLTALSTRGRMDKVLPILERIGFDAVHPVEPECNDLAELKTEWRSRMALVGGVPLSLLAYGSWETIEETVRRTCASLAPGGGYVLGASGPITEGVPPQNVWAMVQATHKYGSYATLGSEV